MADRLPTRPPRTNWGNLSKNLALWLLVGLLALALFQMMSRQRNPTQEFSYTEFSRQLDQGNIARVEVYDGNELIGGLYGVSLGRAFFGESMFHRARDASKIAPLPICSPKMPEEWPVFAVTSSVQLLAPRRATVATLLPPFSKLNA